MKPSPWLEKCSIALATFVAFAPLAACGGGAGTADAGGPPGDGAPPSGTFSASWMLVDGDAPISCDAVGATIVRYTFIPAFGNGNGFVGVFDCAPGAGMTTPHEVGAYSVSVQLKNGAGQVLAQGPSVDNQVLTAGQNTALAPVTFTVTRTGRLSTKIKVPGTSNCAAEPGGAGLTGVRLELRDAQGTCVPTAFDVAAGAMNGAQTIAAGCPGPISPCIENDQVVTAGDINAGSYIFALQGFEGGSTTSVCYTSTTQVTISGGDLETNLGNATLPITSDMDAGCLPP
jgi:hypothetical protein